MSDHGRSENLDRFVSEATRPARLLLMEDNKDVIELMQHAVLGLNCILECRQDSECFLCGHGGQQEYDLVLVDLIMPGIDVPKLVEEIVVKQPQASVVMFTRYPGDPEAIRAVASGAMVFVIKPDDIDQQWLIKMLRTFRIKPLPAK